MASYSIPDTLDYQRRLQIKALKYELVVQKALIQRLSAVLSALESRAQGAGIGSPLQAAFQAVRDTAPCDLQEDGPPLRPAGAFDVPHVEPSYSKTMVMLLEYTDRTLDERRIEPDKRYEALLDELAGHLLKTEDIGEEMAERLDILKRGDARDIANSETTITAKRFAQIEASDYEASHAFLTSHPEMLHELETDALLVDDINKAVEERDQGLMRQYVHQLMVLQYCRAIEPSVFFEGITVPSHGVQRAFQKDLGERLQVVWEMGTKGLTPTVFTALDDNGTLEDMARMLVDAEEPGIEELVGLLGDAGDLD